MVGSAVTSRRPRSRCVGCCNAWTAITSTPCSARGPGTPTVGTPTVGTSAVRRSRSMAQPSVPGTGGAGVHLPGALPWPDAPAHHTRGTGHGRHEHRTIQVLPAPRGSRLPPCRTSIPYPAPHHPHPDRDIHHDHGPGHHQPASRTTPTHPASPNWSADTGPSRTDCTGSATSPTTTTTPACAPDKPPAPWPACATSPAPPYTRPATPTSPDHYNYSASHPEQHKDLAETLPGTGGAWSSRARADACGLARERIGWGWAVFGV